MQTRTADKTLQRGPVSDQGSGAPAAASAAGGLPQAAPSAAATAAAAAPQAAVIPPQRCVGGALASPAAGGAAPQAASAASAAVLPRNCGAPPLPVYKPPAPAPAARGGDGGGRDGGAPISPAPMPAAGRGGGRDGRVGRALTSQLNFLRDSPEFRFLRRAMRGDPSILTPLLQVWSGGGGISGHCGTLWCTVRYYCD